MGVYRDLTATFKARQQAPLASGIFTEPGSAHAGAVKEGLDVGE